MRQWNPIHIRQRISSAMGIVMYAQDPNTVLRSLDLASIDVQVVYKEVLYKCGNLEELKDAALNLLIEKEEFYEALHGD